MTVTTVTGWLLDTHALLWMLHGDKSLSKKAAQAIDGKLPLYHSTASFWEIAIKLSGKGFALAGTLPDTGQAVAGRQVDTRTGGDPAASFRG